MNTLSSVPPNSRGSPLSLPGPQCLDEPAVGSDAWSLVSYEGVRSIIGHAAVLDEVCNDNGCAARYALDQKMRWSESR
jgi:hypothetical protein